MITEIKGMEIAKNLKSIQRLDEYHYTVKSQSIDKIYDVISTENGWNCKCPDHIFRKMCCKHIHAVEISIKLRKEAIVRQQRLDNEIVFHEVNLTICPNCNSSNTSKRGSRKNKNYDNPRYQCKDCQKWFSLNLGFAKMKVSPDMITRAMELYFSGESYRKIKKLFEFYDIEIKSHATIYNWIRKYTTILEEYLAQVKPQISDTWRADEAWID